ncbi:MAG: TetR/AcrR family transcriptional regulator, regulator of autoinduction and epiphytic fitness [Actinomycetota bacterium]|nr:TetR/AcrR family transcriptional regulator, regulator of autoinduction and epiphytic fitness [Actinomycetota bacterium]
MTVADGRVGRGTRNREAIVDALLACYEAGALRPSVPEVAARAGVSARSVHNHFADVEALRAEVAQRQWQRFAPLIGSAATVDELVEQRATFYEAVTPVRRAALLSIHDSPAIARNLARLDRLLRRQLEATFPALTSDAHDALELVTSWDAWNRLRTAQGCSIARARRVVTDVVRNLTEGTVT